MAVKQCKRCKAKPQITKELCIDCFLSWADTLHKAWVEWLRQPLEETDG